MSIQKPSKFILSTEVWINAAPSVVWEILTDFEKYIEWNPFVKYIRGNVVIGEKIEVMLQPPQGKSMLFKPKVLEFNPPKKFSWLGSLWMKGIFDGEHIFELIENMDGTTTFHQKEYFNGLLVSLLKSQLNGNTKKGFDALNQAIKKRAEMV